ncbi:testis-expressed protein 44 [Suricata suricatta]|uniref:Testis expressed 44 n=1 Tax=Suricata suricatta TaxID=37032 RepID=A0A673V1S7_SURSU|nr:testis-expressed protein 44 [Suricata suricatta]
MTTAPSGEARAGSVPTHGDSSPTDTSTVGFQSQVPLLADVPAANRATISPEQQDVDQASIEQVSSKPSSASGDKDKHEDAVGDRQEPKEARALLGDQASNNPQMPTSPQDPAWDGQVQNVSMASSPQTFQHDSLVKEETPQISGVPDSDRELAPAPAGTKAELPGKLHGQPAMSPAHSGGQADTETISRTTTTKGGALAEESQGLETLNPDTEASTTSESQEVTEGDLVDGSEYLQDQQLPSMPGGSAPPSPGPHEVAPGRRSLDASLYMADEENSYMRSMTSLLGGGEASISSLADILVWSETTVGMATAILASGHSSVTDMLQSTGPSLRSVSSILGSTFSSGLMTRTSSALHSVTHMLETVEQRTTEGIRSALHYLTSHLGPRQTPTSPNSD